MQRREDIEHESEAVRRRARRIARQGSCNYAMDLMAEHQVRRVPVVHDGDDRLVGIIALAEVAREVGPRAPAEVVKLLEAISKPTRDLAPVSAG